MTTSPSNPDYVDPVNRLARAREVDELVADWIRSETLDEAMKVFEAAEVAAAPVYDAEQLMADEHLPRPWHVRHGRRCRLRFDDRAGAGRSAVRRHRAESSISGGRSAPTTTRCTAICSAVSADRLAELRAAGTI